MAKQRKTPPQSNAKMAEVLAANWHGIRSDSQDVAIHHRIRDIRNAVCQFSYRSTYSSGAGGDHAANTEAMVCSILRSLMDAAGAPRGGLANILGNIHSTRVAAVLNEKRWPPQARPVKEYFTKAVLWILLGQRWSDLIKKFYVADRTSQSIRRQLPHLNERHDEWPTFWAVHYAMDIVHYFFPFEHAALQPYFHPSRYRWDACYDRREVGMAITWYRRWAKATRQRAYIALFVPNATACEAVLDPTHVLPALAFAAREVPSLLKVNVFYPHAERQEKQSFLAISNRVRVVGQSEQDERERIRGCASGETGLPSNDFVEWHSENATTQPPPSRRLRTITAFLFLARIVGVGREYKSSLYILRPNCPDDLESPMAIKVSRDEQDAFVHAAEERYMGTHFKVGFFSGMLRLWLQQGVDPANWPK